MKGLWAVGPLVGLLWTVAVGAGASGQTLVGYGSPPSVYPYPATWVQTERIRQDVGRAQYLSRRAQNAYSSAYAYPYGRPFYGYSPNYLVAPGGLYTPYGYVTPRYGYSYRRPVFNFGGRNYGIYISP